MPGTGRDEVGRLGAAFRQMLGALALSRAEQQRLVQDAGHELRTPLTSLRTNLSVMRRHPDMSPAMQEQILDDLDGEVAELTDLVNELVAVASGELVDQPSERLDLVELAIRRGAAGRPSPIAEHRPCGRSRSSMVDAPRAGLDRAISNIIDNACKFDQTGGDDRGGDRRGHRPARTSPCSTADPGIPTADLTKVFDRFHRADGARTMPGSGLGLAIVSEVVRGDRRNGPRREPRRAAVRRSGSPSRMSARRTRRQTTASV